MKKGVRHPKCMFYLKGKCNSDYRKNKPCNSNKCPYKSGGSFAMAVADNKNKINKEKSRRK